MKKQLLLFLISLPCLILPVTVGAQIDRITKTVPQIEAESHLRFLTADELRGRNTGTVELTIAGRYIAEQFRKFGLQPMGDEESDYLQRVPLYNTTMPSAAKTALNGQEYSFGVDLGVLSSVNVNLDAPIVYIPDLTEAEGKDVKGKIVVSILQDLRRSARSTDRLKTLQEGGAVGLIEIFGPGQRIPWELVLNFLSRPRMRVGEIQTDDEESQFAHVWIRDTTSALTQQLQTASNAKASVMIKGINQEVIDAFNVVGKIEGTDPELKKEHVIMCAHYDHVGVQAGEGQDSIYNGTRDNGIGTTGLINAANYFGKYPPKRSILIIALTGEEKGLLGSQYYAGNPKVPLEETVFAFNIDNSGYTTTDVLTLLDTARTNIDELVYQAASEVGLGVIGDRIPSQNYYERSDQVSFAEKGVPAVNFKMSMVAFDERISKYYHQPNDEFETVDLDYIYKYWRAYIRAAELIGNWDQKPYWMKGDKFEAAGNKLYNR